MITNTSSLPNRKAKQASYKPVHALKGTKPEPLRKPSPTESGLGSAKKSCLCLNKAQFQAQQNKRLLSPLSKGWQMLSASTKCYASLFTVKSSAQTANSTQKRKASGMRVDLFPVGSSAKWCTMSKVCWRQLKLKVQQLSIGHLKPCNWGWISIDRNSNLPRSLPW